MRGFFLDFSGLFDALDDNWGYKSESIEDLKSKGKVTEETKEEGNYVTKRTVFESFDGNSRIVRQETLPKGYEKYQELSNKRAELRQAVAYQDFEKAAILRDEIKELKKALPDTKGEKDTELGKTKKKHLIH